MNLHAPQDEEASSELRNLAAVPRQIISPAKNSSIVGIFQDSLLGSYRFTREGIQFTPRQAMNLLMCFPRINETMFANPERPLSNFDVLSQILPAMSAYFTNGSYDKAEDMRRSNNVIDIRNGRYLRGQLDKGTLGSGSKGLIHRIFNDFGFRASADFIDALQGIVTEYMKQSGFSVGISDLIADPKTNREIANAINKQKQQAMNVIQELHVGVFENNTGKSNYEEFETRMNTILNQAREEGGKIGRKSLDKDNRFVIMVNAGSKGNNLNIVQMISCLGQQNVDGKRIPYGLEGRTLPHFTKYDDSPEARGFVENSFVQGLSPQELFFHAMGGREGLIDTAVKSVTWETPVIVVDNGMRKYVPIGEWIDARLQEKANEVIHYDATQMNMELLNIPPQTVYIPTTDAQGVVSWGEVTAMTRHDPGNMLYEITTHTGRKVTVTASKSLIVWSDEQEEFVEKSCAEIQKGDYLPTTYQLPMSQDVGRVFVPSMSPKEVLLELWEGDKHTLDVSYVFAPADWIREMLYLHEEDETHESLICNTQTRDILSAMYARMGRIVHWKSYLGSENLFVFDFVYQTLSVKNNVFLDQIRSIRPISPEKHPKMYDLTIPSTLNFMIANGLQVRDTSSTGYIQRRLIKGMEDMKVAYDMTVRNNKNKIVQFTYGDDNMDSTKVETQTMPITHMSNEQIYAHFMIPEGTKEGRELMSKIFDSKSLAKMSKERDTYQEEMMKIVNDMIELRESMIVNVFDGRDDKKVNYPVHLQAILRNVENQLGLSSQSQVDLTLLECLDMIEKEYDYLDSLPYTKPTRLFKALFYYYLNPKELLIIRRFHYEGIKALLMQIRTAYMRAIVHPGEMVGLVAAQSIGEPTTQLTLNSFVYETQVIVRNRNGECKTIQMGEFVENLRKNGLDGKTKMEYYPEKDTTYAPVPDDDYWEIQAPDENGNIDWYQIEAGTRHPVINEDGTNTMIRVITQDEHEIIATKAKSFLILKEGKLVPTRGDEISIDDYVPVSVYSIQDPSKRIQKLIPNKVNGVIEMEERNGRMKDVVFVKVKSIEEVPNTTDYAYDLTVKTVRTFVAENGVCLEDTFHFSGISSKSGVTRGVPRIEEILSLSENPKNPSMTVFLKEDEQEDQTRVMELMHRLEHTSLRDVTNTVSIYFDPDDRQTRIQEDKLLLDQYQTFRKMVKECMEDEDEEGKSNASKWVIRFKIDREELLERNLTMDDIYLAVQGAYKDDVECVYSDMNDDNLIMRVRHINKNIKQAYLDQSDEIYRLKNLQDVMLDGVILRGVRGIGKVTIRKIPGYMVKRTESYEPTDVWVLDTMGTNLMDMLANTQIDTTRTITNDLMEIYRTLGIEAVRQAIYTEFADVLGGYINYHHLSMLCDRMTMNYKPTAISRHGTNNDNIGPLAKASFEETPKMFVEAAQHAELDPMSGVSANVMCGQEAGFGTSIFDLVVDVERMLYVDAEQMKDAPQSLDKVFGIDDPNDACGMDKIQVHHHADLVMSKNLGDVDDDYDVGF